MADLPPRAEETDLLQQDLTEAREHLAATSEVLAVLGRSGSDLQAILGAVVDAARQLCRADAALIYLLDGEIFRVARASGVPVEVTDYIAAHPFRLDPGTMIGRVAISRRTGHIRDVLADDAYVRTDAQRVAGFRTVMGAPLLLGDDLVGVLNLWRSQVEPFDERESTLVTAFAAHAAVAIRNAHLVNALEQRSAELEVAGRHKSEFLANMSHELRTPLNAIIGFSEVLLERMFGDLNDRQEEYLRDILSSGRHLLELLNDILDLSKVEAGAMDLSMSSVDVADLVEHCVSLMRERAARGGVQLRTDISPDTGSVRADELRLKQVLLNLLTNAVKFTPDGGSVTVAAARQPSEVYITVVDTGVGIAAADHERIFDSFQQAGRDPGRLEGTGLGLTLCKRIVELHGGDIWVDSAVGRGSLFGLRLPVAEKAGSPAEPGSGGPLVLLIEDDPSSVGLMRAYLEGSGYAVAVTGNGRDGLAAVGRERPVAVVLDIRLPDMAGWDVLRALKSDPATTAVPVVVISVMDEQVLGAELGASAYLVKPVSRDAVLATLSDVAPLASAQRVEGSRP